MIMNVNKARSDYITRGINNFVGTTAQIPYGDYAVTFDCYILPDRLAGVTGVNSTPPYEKTIIARLRSSITVCHESSPFRLLFQP
jgi:hypothetical protein